MKKTPPTRKHKGIYGYIGDDGKVLLVRKKRGPYKGRYDLPGGKQEPPETEIETLWREISEETGCTLTHYEFIKESVVLFADFVEDDGRPGLLKHTGSIYRCKVSGSPRHDISDQDSDGALWVDKAQLNKKNSTPFVIMCTEP